MLHRFKLMFSKGLGFVYVYLRYHLRNKNKVVNNKNILIIFGGHIGNAVLNIDTILQIREHYTVESGWNIFVLCHESIRKVLYKFENLDGITFLDISYPYKDGGTKFASVYNTLKRMRGMEFDKIVVNLAHIMPLAAYIVATIPANDSIGVFDDTVHESNGDIEHNFGNARWYFERAYKTAIKVDYNTQETQRQKLILEYLNCNYKVRVYPIKKLCEFQPPSRNYCTITIDSTSLARRWEPDKFAKVINFINESYDFDICITGDIGAENIFSQVISNVQNRERVMNFVGKTNFDEWVELLRGSEFHFGVDSGSIHIASSVGTQAFCMVGAWDGKRALPYRVDVVSENTKLPICIYMPNINNLPCYGCIPKKGGMGSGNPECLHLCKSGEPCYCLKNIEAKEAFNVIEKWLNNKYVRHM